MRMTKMWVFVWVVRSSRVLDWVVDWVVDWVGVVQCPRERRGVDSVVLEDCLKLEELGLV